MHALVYVSSITYHTYDDKRMNEFFPLWRVLCIISRSVEALLIAKSRGWRWPAWISQSVSPWLRTLSIACVFIPAFRSIKRGGPFSCPGSLSRGSRGVRWLCVDTVKASDVVIVPSFHSRRHINGLVSSRILVHDFTLHSSDWHCVLNGSVLFCCWRKKKKN